jgi:RNA ligase
VNIFDYVDRDTLDAALKSDHVKMQWHPVGPLAIYNYTNKAQYENVWNDATTKCRGLIWDVSSGEVVARPFEKFFNWGQVDRDMLPSGPIRVQDKMDGSLGILYREPSTGELAIATRGSFTSDQALHATHVLRTKYAGFVPLEGCTYLFEIVYPANRIVVDYGDTDDLVLLDVLENKNGLSILNPLGRWFWPGPVVEEFEFDSITDVLSTEPRPGAEGFVVTYPNGFRVKIKQDEYVRLHRLLTGVSNKSIWEILSTGGDINEIIDRVPDEYYHWVRNTVKGLYKDYDRIAQTTWQTFGSVISRLPAQFVGPYHAGSREKRKWFAEQIKDSDYKGILFTIYDDKDVSGAIWRLVKPQYSKPFWNLSEDVA